MTYHKNDRSKTPKRAHKISIRASDEELAELKNRAADQPLAEWLRELGLGQQRKRERERWTPPPTVDPQLIRHIAMIGNNINQIARALNKNPNADSMAVLVEIQHIQKGLNQLVEIHRVSENNGG
jgi:hypothetical protein